MDMIDRYQGTLLGLAAGDALGTTLEFHAPGSFEPIADMIGGGPFHLDPGQWTDDTSMALCLAESLIEKQAFDPADQMQRYCRWYREGHLSSTGRCFDIGNTIRGALTRFELNGEPYAGQVHERAGGNGSLMRLAPIPLAYAQTPTEALENAGRMSRTTHGSPEAIDACRYYTGLIIGALQGHPKAEILGPRYCPVHRYWESHSLSPKIDAIAMGLFKGKAPPAIRGTGYVVDSLEAALWAFHNSASFEEGALLAVNLGDDADTTGAIYGQLGGAFYGIEGIPKKWLETIALKDTIVRMAEQLHQLSSQRFTQGNGS